MARPPKPTHLKILAGEREDRINRNAPIPSDLRDITPPDMSDGARKVWDDLAPDLIAKHVLTRWDVDTFAVFCNAVAVYRDCARLLDREYAVPGSTGSPVKSPYWSIMRDCAETMLSYGSRFGLTPSDRSRLDVTPTSGQTLGAERILD